jgi:hypothetical protein
MAVVRGPQWFRHPTQKCKNCEAPIIYRPQWEDGGSNWGGTEAPMGDEKQCENRCPPNLSGAYDPA